MGPRARNPGEHAAKLEDLIAQTVVGFGGEEVKVAGEEELVFEFDADASRLLRAFTS